MLRAIVADFVSTKEPIGSKSLVERHNLGVSSATVRNDMAVLEAEGYIAQPHTSSGRVPTEKGYREFVDRLDDVKPLSSAERRAILTFLESGVDLDDVLRRAVRLACPAHQAGRDRPVPDAVDVDRAPPRGGFPDAGPLLLVVITDSGRVDQRIVELGDAIDDHQLSQLRERLGSALEGKPLAGRIDRRCQTWQPTRRQWRARRRRRPGGDGAGRDRSSNTSEERLLLGGTANLTRNTADFGGSLRLVLEALEEQVVVLRLLAAQQGAGKVTVRIGHETEAEQMAGTSVVSTDLRKFGQGVRRHGRIRDPPGWTIRELSLMSQLLLCILVKS